MGTGFSIDDQQTPIIAVALHDGHAIDNALKPYLLLQEHERAREEDPYTWYMICHLPVTKVRVYISRFQLDLNRFPEKAIYQQPEDAWGLNVWQALPPAIIAQLQQQYRAFYAAIFTLVEEAIKTYGYAIIIDVHSYNYRREAPDKAAANETHPEINVGTAYNDWRWSEFCKKYVHFLSAASILNGKIDARENVIFKGGGFAQQLLTKYGLKCCVLSVEFKKTFMDEWIGVVNMDHLMGIKKVLSISLDFLKMEMQSRHLPL